MAAKVFNVLGYKNDLSDNITSIVFRDFSGAINTETLIDYFAYGVHVAFIS
ncbi:MAG: hypothetical protein JXR41_03640 [Bacteroidales bacterium]|nr:hypothetical protein [Bacteroidales bacterium]MBN2762159.1 hypothetical protein [Bacteroidales bacterium]